MSETIWNGSSIQDQDFTDAVVIKQCVGGSGGSKIMALMEENDEYLMQEDDELITAD